MNVPPAAMAPLVIVGAKGADERAARPARLCDQASGEIGEHRARVIGAPRPALRSWSAKRRLAFRSAVSSISQPEKLRLERPSQRSTSSGQRILGKLANEKFVANASLNWSRPSASGWSNSTCKETRSALLVPRYGSRSFSSARQLEGRHDPRQQCRGFSNF